MPEAFLFEEARCASEDLVRIMKEQRKERVWLITKSSSTASTAKLTTRENTNGKRMGTRLHVRTIIHLQAVIARAAFCIPVFDTDER